MRRRPTGIEPGSDGRTWARRDVLRTLGYGAAGLSAGGLGLLAGCRDDGASSDGGGPRRTSTSTSTSTTSPPVTRASAGYDPAKPYWEQGGFAAVTTEETITDLRATGTIPSGLSGLFVRNGSNPPSGRAIHWFLGDGMVHGVRLERGKASWYRNRYVQTTVLDPNRDPASLGGPPGDEANQSNVAVVHHAGKLLSLGEVGWPYQLDPTDLATVGPWSFDGKLGPTLTAHPKVDPDTGRLHAFGYELLEPKLTYYAVAADGTLEVASPIAVDAAVMVHDFAVTDRDAVFWIGPVVFGTNPANRYPDVPFTWDPTGPSKVGVLPLDGSGDAIRWVDVPLGYAFHGLNAHREGDDVIVHLHRMEQAFGPLGDLVPSYLTEWRIGTGGAELSFAEDRVNDRTMDLPTIDRRFLGRESRHGWFATTTSVDAEFGFELAGICHLDLETGEEDVWDPGPDRRAGEGFFVADGAGEGEGWILTYVWDRTTDRSSLAIFDAQALAAGPVAEVELPVRVPFGFHGLWVDEADL